MCSSKHLSRCLVGSFFALIILVDSVTASAGPANGGGGKVVVCPDSQHTVNSVVLLDLWEGREIRNQVPLTVSSGLAEYVNALLERVVPILGGNTDRRVALKWLQTNAAPFFDPGNKQVLWLTNAGLNLTEDSYELIYPRGCKVEQVVNYQPGGNQILIDQKLFDNMDLTNKAALIVHEALYKWLRRFEGDMNSIRARRVVSYVLSHAAPLATPPPMEWTKGQVVCTGQFADDTSSIAVKENVIVFSADKRTIDFRSLNGEMPKGYSLAARQPQQGWYEWFRNTYFRNDNCMTTAFDFGFDGPVEYDTMVQLVKDCNGGKTNRRIGIKKPGESEFQYTDLKCRRLKKGEWGSDSRARP